MKKKDKGNLKKVLIIIATIMIIICYIIVLIGVYLEYNGKIYENILYKNTYIENKDISETEYESLKIKLNKIKDELLSNKVYLKYNDINIETNYKELGVNIDIEKTISNIINKQKNITNWERLGKFIWNKKNNYEFIKNINSETLKEYLNSIKEKNDTKGTNEHFDFDENGSIKYIKGTPETSLNIEKTSKKLKEKLLNDITKTNSIKLDIDLKEKENHDSYAQIDTKVSSFTTEFNQYISRATNLRSALNHINGVILEPGEVFSFYKYAGPYNKYGYVFYYEFVGNGVCQIASTVYNAALLGGLEIVERYQHANPVPYVDGGLDATVASYAGGWYVDFKFKNTYKYPIYISAYAIDGTAHVDFWSNSNAKEGYTYQTESVRIGYLGYNTYLHVYKDGKETEKRFLATTWYKEKIN